MCYIHRLLAVDTTSLALFDSTILPSKKKQCYFNSPRASFYLACYKLKYVFFP
jgi:hypothetical protein